MHIFMFLRGVWAPHANFHISCLVFEPPVHILTFFKWFMIQLITVNLLLQQQQRRPPRLLRRGATRILHRHRFGGGSARLGRVRPPGERDTL